MGASKITLQAGTATLSGIYAAAQGVPRALIFGIHGGSYTSHYFNYRSMAGQTLFDLAPSLGYSVVAIDRPGYGLASGLMPSFDEQAPMLADAAKRALGEYAPGSAGVFIVGHSIGGMLATLIAAHHPFPELIGLDVSGAGLEDGNPAVSAMLKNISAQTAPSLRSTKEARTSRMFGPPGTWDAGVPDEDYDESPPSRPHEIREAVAWGERVPQVAPKVRVPIRVMLAEHDGIWRATPEIVARLGALHTGSPRVEAGIQPAAGHCNHLHKTARAYNLRTLAFIDECVQSAPPPDTETLKR